MRSNNTLAQVLRWEQARVGLVGLPQQWTPSNWDETNTYDNDCALFQSYALFGDGRYWLVSQFAKDARGSSQWSLTPAVGSLACFRWQGSTDDYDHIGFVIAVHPGGIFQTIEANTSGIKSRHQVAIKSRSIHDVVGFAHPAYAGTVLPATTTHGAITEEEDDRMKFYITVTSQGAKYLYDPISNTRSQGLSSFAWHLVRRSNPKTPVTLVTSKELASIPTR